MSSGRAAAVLGAGLAIALASGPVRADDRALAEDMFVVKPPRSPVLDAGVLVGLPSALPTGLTTGIAAGVTRTCGCNLAYGARLSWSTATDTSQTWTVTHGELRARAIGAIRHDAGRGTLALRLGLGATVVDEHRSRNQGTRAGLMGSALEQSELATLPAGELEAVVGLRVIGGWAFQIAAGPGLVWIDDRVRGGWTAELGVAWHP